VTSTTDVRGRTETVDGSQQEAGVGLSDAL